MTTFIPTPSFTKLPSVVGTTHALFNSKAMMAITMMATALTSTASGCIDPEAADGDIADSVETGSVAQHFTGGLLQWLFVTQPAQADLGASSTVTPFLNSVAGSLVVSASSPSGMAGVVTREDTSTHKNTLYVWPSPGNQLGGGGASVSSVANRILPTSIDHGTSGSSSEILGPTTAHRRCFLTGVWNDPTHEAFRSSTDLVQTIPSGSSWVIKATGNVLAAAGCADVTTVLGQVTWSGAGTVDLGPAGAGKFCFLTAVGGAFRTNDWNDGVIISVNQLTGHWQMKVSAGKIGTAECDI